MFRGLVRAKKRDVGCAKRKEKALKMRLESIKLHNFRSFKDAEMRNIPNFCVLVGANGVGKSTLFSVFEFLKDSLASNVNSALSRLGGIRGIREVRSRGTEGPIEIEIKFRATAASPLATYFLRIDERQGRAYIAREILKYRRGSKGQPWHFLDFADGKGWAITNEQSILSEEDFKEEDLQRSEQTLKSDDILAIKGLAQFKEFPVVQTLGDLIDAWHVSDFHVNRAREEQLAGYAEHLSREGENLSVVLQYLYVHHRVVFDRILKKLGACVPGVTSVEPKITEDGKLLLKFSDGAFEDPFLARFVSDGTIKMLAYLVLLNDPRFVERPSALSIVGSRRAGEPAVSRTFARVGRRVPDLCEQGWASNGLNAFPRLFECCQP